MTRPVRVAYLQKAPSGHMNACLRALVDSGADLLATLPPSMTDAPHDAELSSWLPRTVPIDAWDDAGTLMGELEVFDPDILLVVSWDKKIYRECARAWRGRAVRVLCMDNQWMRTPKQLLGIASSRLVLHPCFDRVFLPGDRQRKFANLLGFDDQKIDTGFYSADVAAFTRVDPVAEQRSFAFVGRLVDVKGVEVLARSYSRYRSAVDEPWPLLIGGTGPLADAFTGIPGIELRGFLDPGGVAKALGDATALVLPSRFEPWGVVVHEATCAGRLVVTTDRCGAADDLVRHLENGCIVAADSDDELLDALIWTHTRSATELANAAAMSRQLSAAFSPSRWASTVISMSNRES